MARPADVGSFGEKLYALLEPITGQDSANAWAFLILCGAIGKMFQEIEDLARDSDVGSGWSSIVDLNRAPSKGLEWLAQMVGVELTPKLTGETDAAYDARQRARIASTDGFNRGTPAAIAAAAQQHLTGSKYVLVNERNGSAWQLGVITKLSETPNQTLVLNALMKQKPAGIILNYVAISGNTYIAVRTAYNTYTVNLSKYATYQLMRDTPPPP